MVYRKGNPKKVKNISKSMLTDFQSKLFNNQNEKWNRPHHPKCNHKQNVGEFL